MVDGRFVRSALMVLLLLVPLVVASAPATDLDAARSLDGQDVSDVAMEPSGQFVAATVNFDTSKTAPTNPLGGLPGTLAGSPAHYDVYTCDFGPVTKPRSGTGCSGHNQTSPSGALSTGQAVSAVSTSTSTGLVARYAVAGPSGKVSFWSQTQATQLWSCDVPGNGQIALNVSMPSDAHRLAVIAAPATGQGSLLVYKTDSCLLMWQLNLSASGSIARPIALDYARGGGVVAVGTDQGVLLFSPETDSQPTGAAPVVAAGSRVGDLMLDDNGDALVAAAANYVVFTAVSHVGTTVSVPDQSTYSADLQGPATAVAMTRDGSTFAAAVGTKVRFFHRTYDAQVATPDGVYDAGATVTSLAYDATGKLLVALAGNSVYGFSAGRTTPIWSFDATSASGGGLDTPLKRVVVSDDAQRIVIAGKTKLMAYNTVLGVSASLVAANGNTTMPPGSTLPLVLSLKNTGTLPDNYSFVVDTPVGWPQASAQTIRLDPDQTGNVTFDLVAPAGQRAGSYGVDVRVRSQAYADQQKRSDVYLAGPGFNVTIPRSVQLGITVTEERVLLRASGQETLVMTVHNSGNEDGLVNLSARHESTKGASWPLQFEHDQVTVPAAGTTDVKVTISAPPDGASGDRDTITLVAKEGTTVEADHDITAYVDAQFGVELTSPNQTYSFAPSEVKEIQIQVRNTGNTEDTYNLTTSLTPAAAANDWSVTIGQPSVTVARGITKTVLLDVRPRVAQPHEATLVVSAQSQTSPSTPVQSYQLSLVPKEKEATPTSKGFLPFPSPIWIGLVVLLVALVARGGRR